MASLSLLDTFRLPQAPVRFPRRHMICLCSTTSAQHSLRLCAMQFSDQLFAAGVFAQGIAFPTVARDKGRVRTIVTAAHTRADLEEALGIFASVGRAMELI